MELKPCPFCDNGYGQVEQVLHGLDNDEVRWTTGCDSCTVIGNELFMTEKDAIAAWNYRPELARIAREIEALPRVKGMVHIDDVLRVVKGENDDSSD